VDELGFVVYSDAPYDQAVRSVTEALKKEGFGVLTRIDVKETLKEKIGEDFRPYVIIGACNPPLAHKALSIDPAIGLMLPCNVTVEESKDGGSVIRLLNPKMIVNFGNLQDNNDLLLVADEAFQKIKRVALSLQG
jgi:uncharacterized protein (DUF302 family)